MQTVRFGDAFLLTQSSAKRPSFLARLAGLDEADRTARRFEKHIASHYPDAETGSLKANQRLVLTGNTKEDFQADLQRRSQEAGLEEYPVDHLFRLVSQAELKLELMERYATDAKRIDLDA